MHKTFTKVAEITTLSAGEGKTVEADGHMLALFNVDGTYYAIDNRCPHRGGPLARGRLTGTTVVCPWHAAEFDVASGCVKAPPARDNVKAYAVKVEGNSVLVEI